MPHINRPSFQPGPQQLALAHALSGVENFNTPLSAQDELAFQRWKLLNAPQDSGEDYDLRGAFKEGISADGNKHWPDTYKKPNHPTFSDQSIYSSLTGTRPGTWQGEEYRPFGYEPRVGPTSSNFLNSIIGDSKAALGQGVIDTALLPIEVAQKAIEYGLENAAEGIHQLVEPTAKGFQWYKSPFDRPPDVQDNPPVRALQRVIEQIRNQAGSSKQTPWGFHEPSVTAGAGVEAGLQGAGQVLDDPRNAWMGLGPLGVLGGMSRFRRVPDFGRDAGGFSAPTRQMRRDIGIPLPNRRLDEVPGGDEKDVRNVYQSTMKLYNDISDSMRRGPFGANAPQYLAAQDQYASFHPAVQEHIQKTLLGRQALEQELLRNSQGLTGGSAPSAIQLKRFGFGN